MIRPLTFVLVGLASVVLPDAALGQAKRYPLVTTDGLRLLAAASAFHLGSPKRRARRARAP
jgi:hypothetical protein